MPALDYLADTSAIVLLLRQDTKAQQLLSGKQLGIAFVTLAELTVGALKARRPESALQEVAQGLTGMIVFAPNQLTTRIYADVFVGLDAAGQRIPPNDIWIAAIAIQNRLPLVARDAHFSRVKGLRVVEC